MSSLLRRLWLCSLLAIPLSLAEALVEGAIAAQPDAPDALGPVASVSVVPVSEVVAAEGISAPDWPGSPVTEASADPPSMLPGASASLANASSAWVLEEFGATAEISPLAEVLLGDAVDESAVAGERVDQTEVNPDPVPTLNTADEPSAEPDSELDALTEPVEPVVTEPVVTEPVAEPVIEPVIEPAIAAPEPNAAPIDPAVALELLREGDALWQMGLRREAEVRYRLAKAPFDEVDVVEVPPLVTDPEALPPEGQVYWREAEAGRSQNSRPRMESALRLLTQQHPEFVLGHLRYAEVLAAGDRSNEALAVLERAVGLYPDSADLAQARVAALATNGQLVEAAIAARQFALMYPDDPAAAEFEALAAQHARTFRNRLERDLRAGAIANLLTGALGFALTGNLFGPISSIQTGIALLRGEENVGEAIARRAARQLPLIQDEAVNAYVNDIGQRLAAMTGRSEFEYEFFIIRDRSLNAFALPGGKIFINAGAILKAQSEAELAGLIAHELAHTSLSHGFQLAVDANTLGNAFQLIPYGGYAANLLYFNYSRDMERQADAFGTRLLASAGYAADGLHGLMVTLEKQERRVAPFEWLSTHPDTRERQRNIERQIRQNGYNRYAYEGIDRHAAMRLRVQTELGLTRLRKPTAERRPSR
ncbi:M48 family metallopeptidase [Thermoleptolyngbya sp. C42_A2020_037]|uniref:M48 family metallopeptidase n=1 Tax=Thermoleptolyngbya sp. C42_A2020_037 TaxID=2747799 RepID=UPI001A0219B2|nr:M48 family metalloprotease [Thermoleptolyngbya sp. C42_A2020_037]MBF2084232.1 M48 family metalloprotease [Thermoleptolyngbya sp. C42_A2020_037]